MDPSVTGRGAEPIYRDKITGLSGSLGQFVVFAILYIFI